MEQKLKILIELILDFIKSKLYQFQTDCKKAGAVARALQSRQAHVFWEDKDSMYYLSGLSENQPSSSQGKSCLTFVSHDNQDNHETGVEITGNTRSHCVVTQVDEELPVRKIADVELPSR